MSPAPPLSDLGLAHRFVPGRDGERLAPVLTLHGAGGDESELIGLAQRVAPGRSVLAPRGAIAEERGARFFRRGADGGFDRDDLKARTRELGAFVRSARARYRLPAPVALGLSNGANIAWSLLFAEPAAFCGLVLLRAMLPFDPRPLPHLPGLPVLLIAGAEDELVPPGQAGLLAALLGEAGADVTYEVVRAGHGLTGHDLKLAAAWFASRRPGAA